MACTTRIRSLRPLAAVAAGGLSLGLGSFCVLAQGQEAGEPVLPEITVVARRPPYDPARESGSLTVLDRDTLARSEERALNEVLRGLLGVTLQQARVRCAHAEQGLCSMNVIQKERLLGFDRLIQAFYEDSVVKPLWFVLVFING